MKIKNQKIYIGLLVLVLIGAGVYIWLGRPEQPTPQPSPQPPVLSTQPIDLSGLKKPTQFSQHYSLASLEIPLKTAQYELPLELQTIANFNDFSSKVTLSNKAKGLLQSNGFAVMGNRFHPNQEYITEVYQTLKDEEIPVFITADSLLHLYHIQFDETLRQIEEREFYDDIWTISKDLFDYFEYQYGAISMKGRALTKSEQQIAEAAKRNAAYFAVGLSLLEPKSDQLCPSSEPCQDPGIASAYFKEEDLAKYQFEVPDFIKQEVNQELSLIKKHTGFSVSPIFKYREDYSQYVPRGHYTRSEKLKNYFKAFMWYSRISFLLKGKLIKSENPEYDAKIQTIGASLTASKIGNTKKLKQKWDRIYAVTSFYVGLADDLGPYQYIDALNSVFKGKFEVVQLPEKINQLKIELAKYQPPKIYGGTGGCEVTNLEQAKKCLEDSQGFRLMGQRFIPDSYMFTKLVSPRVGMYTGNKNPFTKCVTQLGPARCFPRGLDVMAILGSNRAKNLLKNLGDTDYSSKQTSYQAQFEKLDQEFDSFSPAQWQKNLYWSWLYSLKALVKEFDSGYPTFMQTRAWLDKELTTALASWTELRHDTILYAKQSYTPALTAMPPAQKPVVGYIEPVPEFYNRLLALTQMTNQGLDKMKVLDEESKARLSALEDLLQKLVKLSKKELNNKQLEPEDYDFIKNFADQLNGVIAEVPDKSKKTTLVADVHTDQNTRQVLEEGVGYVKLMAVAYKVPDGRILIGAGPVMSYYEFKHPMQDRLTDEKWRALLKENPPSAPDWISNFSE